MGRTEGGQRGGGEGGAIRPGQLSALLQEIAAAPMPSDGGWGAALLDHVPERSAPGPLVKLLDAEGRR